MRKKILKKIEPIFKKVLKEPNLILTEDINASKIEKWDSLNHITLIVTLEQF